MRLRASLAPLLSVAAAIGVPCLLAAAPARAEPPAAAKAEDCEDYYFGIVHPPDFVKALRCFEKRKEWELLIVMQLNGEGTPADVHKAAELLEARRKAHPSRADDLQSRALQEAIDQRLQHPADSYPRLGYCEDIARDTIAINYCAGIEGRKAEAQLRGAAAATRARLPPADAALFDKIVAEFTAFQAAERQRMYLLFIDGTIRGVASAGQAIFVGDQFRALIKGTIDQRELKPADERAYKEADGELNRVYRETIRRYPEELSQDDKAAFENDVNEFNRISKEAQLHWIRYRDLTARLARALYRKRGRDFDAEVSMKTAMTRIRVLELRNNPVGPNEGE